MAVTATTSTCLPDHWICESPPNSLKRVRLLSGSAKALMICRVNSDFVCLDCPWHSAELPLLPCLLLLRLEHFLRCKAPGRSGTAPPRSRTPTSAVRLSGFQLQEPKTSASLSLSLSLGPSHSKGPHVLGSTHGCQELCSPYRRPSGRRPAHHRQKRKDRDRDRLTYTENIPLHAGCSTRILGTYSHIHMCFFPNHKSAR